MKNLSKSKIDEHEVEWKVWNGTGKRTEIYCDFVIAFHYKTVLYCMWNFQTTFENSSASAT
jgi:hypothetical protein